jgi:hypothetical protein
MNATKTMWSPIVEKLKKELASLSTGAQSTMLKLVSELETVLSAGIKRQYYPKLFSIERKGDLACLQEEIVDSGQDPIYCYKPHYDAIAQAVAQAAGQNIEFDREELLTLAREFNPRVTKPAVITVIRFWMSIGEPLLLKNVTTNKYDSNVDPEMFIGEATLEFNELSHNPLRLEKPQHAK